MYNSGMMNDLDEDLEVLDRVPFDLDAAIRDLQIGPLPGVLGGDAAGSNVIRYIKFQIRTQVRQLHDG